jgi:hypothetical protein
VYSSEVLSKNEEDGKSRRIMMTCDRAQAQLNDLFDNQLNSRQKAILLAHLDECETCKGEYEVLQAVVLLVQKAPVQNAPESQNRVLMRFRQEVSTPAFAKRQAWTRLPFVSLGFAAAAVGGLSLLFFLPRLDVPQISQQTSTTALTDHVFPNSNELDFMAKMHAAGSVQEQSPNSEIHSETFTDALTRLTASEGKN